MRAQLRNPGTAHICRLLCIDWPSEYCWCSVDIRRYWAAGTTESAGTRGVPLNEDIDRTSPHFSRSFPLLSTISSCAKLRAPTCQGIANAEFQQSAVAHTLVEKLGVRVALVRRLQEPRRDRRRPRRSGPVCPLVLRGPQESILRSRVRHNLKLLTRGGRLTAIKVQDFFHLKFHSSQAIRTNVVPNSDGRDGRLF
jgi:hypothetical protein